MALILIKKIFQLFLIMFLGFIIVKAKVLKSDDSMVLSRLTLYLIMPFMILNAFQVDLTDEIKIGLIAAVIVALVIHIILVTIGWLCQKFLQLLTIQAVYQRLQADPFLRQQRHKGKAVRFTGSVVLPKART